MVGAITKITSRLKQLDADDPERITTTQQLLERLSAEHNTHHTTGLPLTATVQRGRPN